MAEHNTTPTAQRTRRQGQRMTAEEKKKAKEMFLRALGNTANVRAACMQAGVDTSTVYRWQEQDQEFGEQFSEANKNASWLLFGEAWQRAMKGEEEYVVSAGKIVYGPDGKPLTKRVKSDRLLELMLKARITEFRTNTSPFSKASEDVQPVEPQHGLYIAHYEYATNEELRIIEDIQTAINARKEEAEQGKIVQMTQRRTG